MYFFEEFLDNRIAIMSILAWFIAQVIKFILTLFTEKKADYSRFYGAGGMPSSHSSTVTTLAVCMGQEFGFDSAYFAVCMVFGIIVMYDAAGVRLAAGKQAAAINLLFNYQGVKRDEQLKELLGHTPLQVFAGFLLGIVVGLFY